MNPAENIVGRVDSPNHAIGTSTNIDQTTSDLNPGLTIIAREREDVACAVDPPHIGFHPCRDRSEGTGNCDPVIGISLIPGIANLDVASGVDPPNRAIGTRANVGQYRRDLDPGVAVITCVTKDVASSVDPPDIGARSGGDFFESTGNFGPVIGTPGIAKDLVGGVDPPNCAISSCANVG